MARNAHDLRRDARRLDDFRARLDNLRAELQRNGSRVEEELKLGFERVRQMVNKKEQSLLEQVRPESTLYSLK
eukprot:9195596-Pyramimonas_sp.AAC.1